MFDYMLYTILFLLGSITKLVLFPVQMFSGVKFTTNPNFVPLVNKIVYYVYSVLSFMLTFILGTYLVAQDMVGGFIALWIVMLLVDAAMFALYYNPNGNFLGSPVAFTVLLRDGLFAVISVILLLVFCSSDYDTRCTVYGGIIWGFGGAKVLDSFVKYYVFTSSIDDPYLTRGKRANPTTPTATFVESIWNAVNVGYLAIFSVVWGFIPNSWFGSLLAILYILFVAAYLVQRKLFVDIV